MEQRPAPGLPGSLTLGSPKSPDYSYAHPDGIKESFLTFSARIYDLDKQLGNFANECLSLGRVAGLLLANKKSRELLRQTREVFFRNATELLPELHEWAREDRISRLRNSDLSDVEHYYIPLQYFKDPLPPFDLLPKVLEDLGRSFGRLRIRIEEFREFTDEGHFLRSLLLTMERDLMYRASCVRVYSSRLNTPPIQRYIHQFTDDLERDFQKITTAVDEYTSVGVSAICHEQERSSESLTNILTVATFFSGVTAGTLSMSTGAEGGELLKITSMLWFASLAFSVGAALNSLLAMAWKETRSGSRGGKMPFWVTMWIDGSQLLFLGVSIVTFSAGLITFAFATNQAIFTPWVTVGATGVTFIGLVAILIWLTYEIAVAPAFIQEAKVIKSGAESTHSHASKLTMIGGGISGAVSNALFSLGLPKLPRNGRHEDVEDPEEKDTPEPSEDEESLRKEEKPPPSGLVTKLQTRVKDASVLGSAASAFLTAGNQHRRGRHIKSPSSTKEPRIDTNISSVPMTQLKLPTKPANSIELARYGIIQHIAYSEDGKWLGVTCANMAQSWTGVYRAESLESYAEAWHEGRVISERLIWSPSGKKLIIKFEHRFDVWDVDAKDELHIRERYHNVKDIQWCGDEAFLVAEHNCVFKMNLLGVVTVYRFDHMHVRSIGIERRYNYLIVITRVTKSPEQIEPASSRSEKRIVIYDMEKEQAIYKIPVLENISNVYPIAGELDMLVTHADNKAIQMWSLDAGVTGAGITARLKKRDTAPQLNSTDYVGPTCLAGNFNQFIMNVTSSGAIDIWRRGNPALYQRFEHRLLQEEGVRCFSWRKSRGSTATFATAGIDSNVLRVWQGEEPEFTKTPTSLEPMVRSFSTGGSGNGTSPNSLSAGSSSGVLSAGKMDKVEESTAEDAPRT